MKAFKKLLKKFFQAQILEKHIRKYKNGLKPGEKFKVIFGGHWANHAEWFVLSEADQDITRPLSFSDGSVDVIFSEHVIEHVPFLEGISFMKESLRILKSGGVFRVVTPTLEKILALSLEDERGKIYMQNIERFYAKEDAVLADLGLKGVSASYRVFYFNSIFTGFGHKFVWSAELIRNVLKSLGYSEAHIYEVGQGENEEYCIERRRRGLYLGNDWQEDRSEKFVYDIDSLVVEAKK